MNLISWERGDWPRTDTPSCTARPLALMVQHVNDHYCGHLEKAVDGPRQVSLLCPACARRVLDLAHRTVGTANAGREHTWRWIADLLTGELGVLRLVRAPALREYVENAAGVARVRAEGGRYVPDDSPVPSAAGASHGRHDGAVAHLAALVAGNHYLMSLAEDGIEEVDSADAADYVVERVGRTFVNVRHIEGRAALLCAAQHAVDIWEAISVEPRRPAAPVPASSNGLVFGGVAG